MTWRTYDSLGREQVAPLASPPGAWEFLEKKTASASANIDFDLPVGFNTYRIVFRNVLPVTDGAILFFRVSEDGGATFEADAGDYSWLHGGVSGSGTTPAQSATVNDSDTEIEITSSHGNVAGEEASGILDIFDARSTTRTKGTWQVGYLDSAPTPGHVRLNGYAKVTTAIVNDAVRFLFSTGNISSGEFVLYGLRETSAPGSDGAPQAFRSLQVFTTDGTWNRPPGITKVLMKVIGGGGAGGGAAVTAGGQVSGGGGGGGGCTAVKLLDVSNIASSTITVGAGGTGVSGGAGNAGAASSWADGTNTISANGGSGGAASVAGAATSAVGGAGNAVSAGADHTQDGQGGTNFGGVSATLVTFGAGGCSAMGGGARSVAGQGEAGNTPGGGGGGSSNTPSLSAKSGGAGGVGEVIVWEFA